MKRVALRPGEIEADIRVLREFFSIVSKDPRYKPTNRKKFNKWVRNFDTIFKQISAFDKIVLPKITSDLGYSITNRDLVLTAIIQPSVKNIFSDIKKQFGTEPEFVISQKNLNLLEGCSDVARSLAWIGDASIHYAISNNIWKPEITPEKLDNKRKSLESDENLSILCNKWELFKYRIHFDPEVPKLESLIKIKGTLVEAIYGIIYIENGIEGVQNAVHLIDTTKT